LLTFCVAGGYVLRILSLLHPTGEVGSSASAYRLFRCDQVSQTDQTLSVAALNGGEDLNFVVKLSQKHAGAAASASLVWELYVQQLIMARLPPALVFFCKSVSPDDLTQFPCRPATPCATAP
jgi:hypothetical protein